MRRGAMALAGAAALLARPALRAQTLASRISAVRDGTVQIAVASRPEVCGNGDGSIWIGSRSTYGDHRPGFVCIKGPVRVSIGRTDGQTVSIRTCVACAVRASGGAEHDLGVVAAVEAARYLVDEAHRFAGKNAEEAISAAAFADSVDIAPALAALVRDDAASIEARKQAMFWYGQGDASTTSLRDLYDAKEPLALRRQFTFVVSQRRDDPAVDELVAVARTDADAQVRKQALFWLGQMHNPKALAFIRSLLVP